MSLWAAKLYPDRKSGKQIGDVVVHVLTSERWILPSSFPSQVDPVSD